MPDKDLRLLDDIISGGKQRKDSISLLYKKYAPQFSNYFRKNNIPSADIEDILQETFINIVRFCGNFRRQCPVKAWLWKIARNCMLTYVRKSRPGMEIELDEGVHTDVSNNETCDTSIGTVENCVNQAFEAFSNKFPDRAHVLTLATIEGWSMAEISEIINRTIGATREYVSQCRKYFKPFVEPCMEYIKE